MNRSHIKSVSSGSSENYFFNYLHKDKPLKHIRTNTGLVILEEMAGAHQWSVRLLKEGVYKDERQKKRQMCG